MVSQRNQYHKIKFPFCQVEHKSYSNKEGADSLEANYQLEDHSFLYQSIKV